jgi:uncharacterized protein YcbX
MLGERLTEVALDARGVVDDRRWCVRTLDGRIGSGKTTRRFATVPDLQLFRAAFDEQGVVVVLPDGARHALGSPHCRSA